MSEERKKVDKGTPPPAAAEMIRRDQILKNGDDPDELTDEGNGENTVMEKTAPAQERRPRKKATMENDVMSFDFRYEELAETDIAFLFILPGDENIPVRPKVNYQYALASEDSARQFVYYLGPPTYFTTKDLNLFILLKDPDIGVEKEPD